ncbi:MAG TPA: hydrogenase maturation protease [Terriglobales bacterium]|nr:hydrogenase maturation protease [Terriglobales bacterium]
MNEWEWQLLEDKSPLEEVEIAGTLVRIGHRVRLHPRQGGDVIDLALAGQIAAIEALEQDYEGKVHVCVVLEDDPGRDLGLLRQPGHRFFFDTEEIEPLPSEEQRPAKPVSQPRILLAGIGNIFMGDDGFGVEVARRLAQRSLPSDVRVGDFGIRGFDLAYALQDGYETTILIDACPRGAEPGTVFVVEPELTELAGDPGEGLDVDAHSMDALKILRLAASMGWPSKRVLLVGCEPATLGPPEGLMGLSEPVEQAVTVAVDRIEALIPQILAGEWPGSAMND